MGTDWSRDCCIRICDREIFNCDEATHGSQRACGTDRRYVGLDGGGFDRGRSDSSDRRSGAIPQDSTQLDAGTFEPAGFVVDLVTILTVGFGLVLAGYLIYTERSL